MIVIVPSPRRVRSLPIAIGIQSDLVMDEFCLGSVDLDEDVMDPSKPFVVPNILKPSKSTNNDLHVLMHRSQ